LQQWKNFANPPRIDKVIAMDKVAPFFDSRCSTVMQPKKGCKTPKFGEITLKMWSGFLFAKAKIFQKFYKNPSTNDRLNDAERQADSKHYTTSLLHGVHKRTENQNSKNYRITETTASYYRNQCQSVQLVDTNRHPFDGLFSSTRKVKPMWILMK